ncbi:hypothetical protein ACN06F_09070 [Vreelandella sp. 21]|uniref:hypothetical protein n=1 Tax=Vreelandella sp. 21 TaxID=3402864 RepID=UPI003D9AA300
MFNKLKKCRLALRTAKLEKRIENLESFKEHASKELSNIKIKERENARYKFSHLSASILFFSFGVLILIFNDSFKGNVYWSSVFPTTFQVSLLFSAKERGGLALGLSILSVAGTAISLYLVSTGFFNT